MKCVKLMSAAIIVAFLICSGLVWAAPPNGSTYPAVQITADSARVKGGLADDGGFGAAGNMFRFHYWTAGGGKQTTTWSSDWYVVEFGGTSIIASVILNDLVPDTWYTFQIEVKNDDGSDLAPERSFQTLARISITSSPGGTVTTPGEGVFEYDSGSIAALEATADDGFIFVGWRGSAVIDAGLVADPRAPVTSVSVEGDYDLVANFKKAIPFSLGSFGDIELGNDSAQDANTGANGSGLGARDIDVRRRVGLISYDVSALRARGPVVNVSFSHFSHDQHNPTNVYGVVEGADLLDVESLTWNTSPGVQNDPTPEPGSPVALDLADLTGPLLTFEGPGETGVRFSTDASQALADFINADTDGIVTFLLAARDPNGQLIIRTQEHSAGGSFLEGEAPSLGNVTWVSEVIDRDVDGIQDDQAWIDMLTNAGYCVDARLGNWQALEGIDANDANDYVGELNAADLVIVSRTANSGGYDDGNEPTLWNSITSPMILMSSHIARNSRWLWFNTGDLLQLLPGATELTVPDHPIFRGLMSPVSFYDATVGSGLSNFFVVVEAGNGTVLATGDGLVQIAEWAPGTEFYEGAGQFAGGRRIFFTAGTQEVGGEQPQGALNLSADGWQAFINAVRYMIPMKPVNPGTFNLTHSYNFDDGTANDSVGSAHGTLEGDALIYNGSLVTVDQDDWLSLPGDVIAMNTYDEVTLEAWYRPAAGANTSWSMLAYFGGNENGLGGNGLFITAARGDDVSRAAISIGNVDTPWSSESGANGPEYDDGLLHHMVGTFDGDVVLYLDGKETGRTPTSETNILSGISNDLALLAKGGYDGDPEWIGEILEFNIFNRALSPAEVLYLYNSRPPALTHSYSFEDGTASDSVGSADGTLEGDAVIVDGDLVTIDQDDWLSLPGEVIAMNTYNAVSIEAWYTPEAGANASWSMLAYFGGNENGLGGNGLFITAARGDDVSRAAISIGNVDTPWSSESGANGPEYDDGLLHHMVGTFNAADVALYLDGVETGRTPVSETNTLSGLSNALALLAKGGYDGDPEWIGAIHEFNIYNRALTAAEVADLFAEGPN